MWRWTVWKWFFEIMRKWCGITLNWSWISWNLVLEILWLAPTGYFFNQITCIHDVDLLFNPLYLPGTSVVGPVLQHVPNDFLLDKLTFGIIHRRCIIHTYGRNVYRDFGLYKAWHRWSLVFHFTGLINQDINMKVLIAILFCAVLAFVQASKYLT